MRKTEIIEKNESLQKSLYAQFIVVYGIMVGISIISIIAITTKKKPFTAADIAGIFVNSFTPTTITLFSTALFEYEFVKDSKVTMSLYIMLTVVMSLFYAMFAFYDALTSTYIRVIATVITSLITCGSFGLLWWMVSKLNLEVEERNKTVSDGHICAVRRR